MTSKTRRRKFIRKARDEAFQKGKNSIKHAVQPWLEELRHFAKKKDWEKVLALITNGPPISFIECAADISMLFTQAQHALDREFYSLGGFVFPDKVPETLAGSAFAARVKTTAGKIPHKYGKAFQKS